MTTVTCAFCGGSASPRIAMTGQGERYAAHCDRCHADGPVSDTPTEALSRFQSVVARTEHERAVKASFHEGHDAGRCDAIGTKYGPHRAWMGSSARAALSHAEPAEQGREK